MFLGWFNTLILAVIIVILAAITTAKGQNYSNTLDGLSVPDDVTNGLFTPTQSQRFFQAGREDFEREIEFLNYPERYLDDDLLQIDPELIEQMNRLQPPADFGSDNPQRELRIDIINH